MLSRAELDWLCLTASQLSCSAQAPVEHPVASRVIRRAIVAEGWNAVVWSARVPAFPYLTGMGAIVSSVLIS